MRTKSELRPYQQRIATHLYENDSALCVVRPGGGKTVSALTAIAELIEHGVIRHALVVAPKRVARNVWPDEIEAWGHTKDIRYSVLAGTPAQRHEMLLFGNQQITIIGLDVAKWLLDTLENVPRESPLFDLLVIDEVSKLRNPTGVRAKLLAKHASKFKMIWGLSGTLRPNSAQDLFMPARVVTKGQLWGKSFYKWRQEYFRQVDYMGYEWAALPGSEEKLNADIAPWTATLHEDEYPQLPGLQVQFDYVELPAPARKAYREMHNQLMTGNVVASNEAVATGKLAQIANGFLYPGLVDGPPEAIHDEKYEWLQDVIEQATGPTLLVYEFQHDLERLQDMLPDLPVIGRLGSEQIIKDWNAGKLPFLALHPAAGGHGLNLQHGGCDMAWIAPTWSPELWEQTIARLHRPGQTKPVIVRVCVAKQTVDEMKLDRVHYKISAQLAFEKYLRAHSERQNPRPA